MHNYFIIVTTLHFECFLSHCLFDKKKKDAYSKFKMVLKFVKIVCRFVQYQGPIEWFWAERLLFNGLFLLIFSKIGSSNVYVNIEFDFKLFDPATIDSLPFTHSPALALSLYPSFSVSFVFFFYQISSRKKNSISLKNILKRCTQTK